MSYRLVSTASRRLARQRIQQRNGVLSQIGGPHQSFQGNSIATLDLPSYAIHNINNEDEQKRLYHTTAPSERAVALILGLATASALGYAGSSAVQSYNEWKASQPSPEEVEAQRKEGEKMQAKEDAKGKEEEEKESKKPRENVFKVWFGVGVGSKFYEGGFEDTMTRREAALILGVRESSSPERIKAAHRKLLVLNHPDTGGSTYMAGKINEAKELLLKGRAKV